MKIKWSVSRMDGDSTLERMRRTQNRRGLTVYKTAALALGKRATQRLPQRAAVPALGMKHLLPSV